MAALGDDDAGAALDGAQLAGEGSADQRAAADVEFPDGVEHGDDVVDGGDAGVGVAAPQQAGVGVVEEVGDVRLVLGPPLPDESRVADESVPSGGVGLADDAGEAVEGVDPRRFESPVGADLWQRRSEAVGVAARALGREALDVLQE